MLIEPVSVAPHGGRWRARLAVAAAAPIVFLLAVVGTSLLTDDGPAIASGPRATSAADATAPDDVAPDAVEHPAPPAGVEAMVAIPRRALGLPAQSVATVLGERRADRIGDRLIAIRGYLTVGPRREDCLANAEIATTQAAEAPSRCRRTAILRDVADPPFSVAAGQLHWDVPRGYPYLHPTIFPGISLGPLDPAAGSPDAVDDGAGDWLLPRPVVVIGRFGDPRVADPRSDPRHPNEAFVIERLAWADGRWQDLRFTRFAPRQSSDLDLRTARALVAEALAGGTVILSQNVVGPSTLASLDPTASAAVRSSGADHERLWYVRAMTRAIPAAESLADGGPRRLGWVVLDNDGRILARRPDG